MSFNGYEDLEVKVNDKIFIQLTAEEMYYLAWANLLGHSISIDTQKISWEEWQAKARDLTKRGYLFAVMLSPNGELALDIYNTAHSSVPIG